jgi:23S rRNA (guanine1835-N2)-methyltransferase
MTAFTSTRGTFQLERLPAVIGGRLLAHDAADALLLEHAGVSPGRTLVVNDNFGALAVPLHDVECASWSDSHIAHRATIENLSRNRLANRVLMVPSTETPGGVFDTVLWRLPRSLDVLRAQVGTLQSQPHGRVFAGGMDKHLPASFLACLREHGTVTVLPGRHKAHVYDVRFADTQPDAVETGRPEQGFTVPDRQLRITGGPHVFAHDRLDPGTRLLLDALDQIPSVANAADLACGTGVLGIALQRLQPSAAVHYFDESYQAIDAARRNVAANLGPVPDERFHVAHGFGDSAMRFDAIVCNPPFHQGNTVGDTVAHDLFRQAAARLAPGGELWVVGNGHLRYSTALRALVGLTRQAATNPKFVVTVATKR